MAHAGTYRGIAFDQDERIHLARVEGFEARPSTTTPLEHEPDDIRWWTLDELAATTETLTPLDLAARLRAACWPMAHRRSPWMSGCSGKRPRTSMYL